MIKKGNLIEKFESFSDHWHPRIIAELNGQAVKIARIKGEFPWHAHDQEDELFYVIEGSMKIDLRDGQIELKTGEFVVIPHGVEHRPSAEKECKILLFEPTETLNTGDQINEFTVNNPDRI